jgi:DNA-binding transcriptional ArsR family regulator
VLTRIRLSNGYGNFLCFSQILFAEQQIYLPNGRYCLRLWEAFSVTGNTETVRVLKALASRSRLQILECVKKGISNPGEIAREVDRHRSTIEKHLRVLLSAKIVEKIPSLTEGGQLTIRYKIRENANELLTTIREISEDL